MSQPAKPYILIVEDETAIATLLEYNLQHEGYEVTVATNSDAALSMAAERVPDLIVLDWMLPGLSGPEICRRLRRQSATQHIPIIMLSARSDEDDRIRGLDIGADDYLTKPFSLPELLARIRALLRRTQGGDARPTQMVFGDLELDITAHRLTYAGDDVHLGPTEFRLLEHLMRRPDQVFSRDQLLNAVWGQDIYVEPRTVDVHIARLRKALKQKGRQDPIRTVRSAGYALRPLLD